MLVLTKIISVINRIKPGAYIVLAFFLIFKLEVSAQSFKQDQVSVANGASKGASTSFKTKVTIGQNVIGSGTATSFNTALGFDFASGSEDNIDLNIQNLALDPTTLGPGTDVSLSFDLRNLGDATAAGGSYTLEVYLSSDQTIDVGEELRTITITSDISADGTYSFPESGDNGLVTIPVATSAGNYFIILLADNGNTIAETDETNNEANAAVTITTDGTSPVLSNFSQVTYFTTGSTVSVNVTDNVAVDRVNFYHRGITTPMSSGWGDPESVTLSSGVYSIELQAAWLDNQGVEYWFEAFDTSNNRDTTSVGYTYSQTLGGELNFPNFKKGRTVADYEMISVPFDLTNKGPRTIFSEFGTYDPKEWRMYHYTGNLTKEFEDGWSTMELGKSYWIINDVGSVSAIQIGEGETPSRNKTNPFTMDLVQGWNQIGNPYRFDVSWDDVLAANGNPSELERYRTWNNGNFADGSTLEVFGGGFVFTNAPVTITIPIDPALTPETIQNSINTRVKKVTNPIDSEDWQVDFVLGNEELKFNYGGFGMRSDANISKDEYDEVSLPRFVTFLEMNFDHPEYFVPRFSKDIIPSDDNHIWEFSVVSNSSYKQTVLSWDNRYFGENDRKLYLFDEVKQRYVDMREVDSYSFHVNSKNRFKVFYGDSEFIEKELNPDRILLGNNYPNPFVNTTVIPFTLPPSEYSYEVELKIFNQMGKEIQRLFEGTYQPGFYEVQWDGNDQFGQRVPSGIYLYHMVVTDDNRKVIQNGKMAVH